MPFYPEQMGGFTIKILGPQAFVDSQNILLTGSKDSHVRVWDLEAQFCFQTLVLPDEVIPCARVHKPPPLLLFRGRL